MKSIGVLVSCEAIRALEGDAVAAVILSQIAYWFRPSAKGKTKLRVYRQGVPWLAKSAPDWHEEVGLSPKQAYRAMGLLEAKGLIDKKVMRFNGTPTTHIRLTAAGHALCDFIATSLPEEASLSALAGTSSSLPGNSLTESTAKTTAGDYAAGKPAVKQCE